MSFKGLFGQNFRETWNGNADKAGLADKLGVLGLGISQLSAGQAPNIMPAWDAVEKRRTQRKLSESMANPELLAGFTPEQQKMLAVMPPEMAQQLIMEQVFAPPPAPVAPDWQQFNGDMYNMNAMGPDGKPTMVLDGMSAEDSDAAKRNAERELRRQDALMLGYAEGSPEMNAYVVSGEMAKPQNLPAAVDEYNFYAGQEKAAGRDPLSFNDWDLQGKKAGAASTTVSVGGGASPQEVSQFNKGVKSANVDQVIEDIKATMAGATLPTTGMIGNMLSETGGTAANDLRLNIDTLKAAASFSSLQAMREASKTGAALGAVSDTEMKLLGAELANLEQSQSKEQFARNLDRFQTAYNAIVDGPQGSAETSAPQPGTTEDGYQFKGGDPADPANWVKVQ